MPGYDAVLLLSFGGPEGPDDVVPFLENVTAGRGIPQERLVEVGAHYDHFDGVSPINEQCRRIQSALAAELADRGHDLPVYWGNRNWHPFLVDTLRGIAAAGHERVLAVVTSAYSSYSGCRQYLDDIERARTEIGADAPQVDKVRAYYDHPGFIEPIVEGAAAAIAELGTDLTPTLVFTAHSIPKSMAASSDYEAQLREAARLVVEGLSDTPDTRSSKSLSWHLAWQSRSGPPTVPWLEPDVNEQIRSLAAADVRQVVLVPIGFVSDHIEVLWDLDVEAAATANEVGIELARSSTPGTAPEPAFISMLAELIEERVDDVPMEQRVALGVLDVRPDRCAVDCCPIPARRPASAHRGDPPGTAPGG
jgi:ferrochelatase